jgi:Divergent InlB B-repeat domain
MFYEKGCEADRKMRATLRGSNLNSQSLCLNSQSIRSTQTGRGSGSRVAGASVTVTADAPPAGQKFAGWTGDIQILANPFLSTTMATMPSIDVTVSATFADVSSSESSE